MIAMSTTLSAVEYMDFVGERHKVDFCDLMLRRQFHLIVSLFMAL